MAKLIIESGPSRGKQFQLPKSGKFAIGRGDKSAVRIDDNMSSRVHCTISCQSDHWVVEDQNSLNGIRLNGEQVSSAKMVAGDLLQVGETLFSVSTGGGESLVGETIAGYQVEKRLGRGAMGTVYLAQQISLDRPVALKILAPRFAKDADFVRHFLHEARAAARLNHPNVVQVYDAGQDGDLHFMSMEFLDGGSLEELLQAEGPLEIERAVEIARDAALALAFAKQNQIVHRDIKPANLLLATDGTVKVCDLGIAADLRAASGGQDESAENKNQFGAAGSPRYMAPEQARGNQPGTPGIDYRADIYALGATLYRMIAGRPPFDGSSVSEIIRAKLESDPSPLRDFAPDVPPGLASAIHRMLAYEPDDRFEDGDEVFEALDE